MIDARAKWTNEALNGVCPVVADPFPPSSREDPSPLSSTRSTAETREYWPPAPAPPEASPGSADDEDLRTEWCVDFGSVLATMDTFELWAAIDRGDITPAVRVWREGMECWTPIEKLPELAVALTTASSRTPEPITLHMPPRAPASGAPPPAPLRAPEPSLDEVRPPQSTLVSGPRTSSWERLSQRILPPPKRSRAGAQLWAALGSAIAATTITAAVVGVAPRRAAISADARGVAAGAPPAAAPPAPPEPAVTASAATTASAAATATATAAAAVDLPLPASTGEDPGATEGAPGAGEARPHHEDRGQHRLRRSGAPASIR